MIKRRENGNHKSVRKPINLVVDIVLLIAFLLVVLTGIIKFPGFLPFLGINLLMIPLNELAFIHDWSGPFKTIWFEKLPTENIYNIL